MRRIKSIRRRKICVLNVLFLSTAFLFCETYASSFFREFAQRQLEELLSSGVRVDVGSIKGGIFRNLISEEVNIYSRQGNVPSLITERMEIDYELWDPVL